MKTILYIILFIFLSCAALTGCRGNREVDNRLSKADALMTNTPDLALSILTGICPDSMSEMQRAWYALLLTKANAKNYLPLDKSLISQAVDYYKGKGDSLEAQALYYLGYFYSENLILDTALVVLNQAYETALAANDIFFAGMSAREMAEVYRYQFIFDEVIKWGQTAKDFFIAADKPVHAAWMDNTIANALIFNEDYDSANALLDSAAESNFYNDITFRQNVMRNRVELALQIDDYKNSLVLYDSLYNNGYTFRAHDRLNQAKAAIAEGLYEEAEKYLSMAQKLNMIEADSLYLGKMTSKLLGANGDYKKAYESAMKFADDLMCSDTERLVNPQTLLLTDNYKLKVENHKLQIQRNREYIIVLIVLCLLLGIIILLMHKNYKRNIERKNSEVDRLMSDEDTMREDLTLSNDRYRALSEENQDMKTSLDRQKSDLNALRENLSLSTDQYEELSKRHQEIKESMDKQRSDFAIEVKGLFARHLDMLNNVCDIWFHHTDKPGSGTGLYREIGTLLGKMSQIEVLESLAEIINRHYNNWFSNFKEAYPDLLDSEYSLVVYLYLGFRPATIAVLTGRTNIQAVYSAKHKLKKKLESGGANPDDPKMKKLFYS